MGGGIKRCFCLTSDVCPSDVCLSRTSGLTREQRGLGRHRGNTRHTWHGHHFQCQKVKGQGHQAVLVCCSSQYIIYIDDIIIIIRASRCLSIMNIHGARRAGAAGVRRAWTGAGLQRAAYKGGGEYCAASRTACYSPPIICGGGGIKRWCCLTSDVCLSVAYIGPKSRTERHRNTKIGTEVAHITVTRTSLSRSKGQRSRSPCRFTHRGVYT